MVTRLLRNDDACDTISIKQIKRLIIYDQLIQSDGDKNDYSRTTVT